MTPEEATKLRAPFTPSQIGKLPRPTKKENPKGRCEECGGWHGLPAVHLDYVGHAAVTDRLLQVDPEWSWKPMGKGQNGEPLLTNGGLWIELTVCGVTRPGFGDESNGKGMKEMIGDAIRNAAMRFGVALDLWAKEDLSSNGSAAEPQAERDEAAAGSAAEARARAQAAYEASQPDVDHPSKLVISFGKNKGTALGTLSDRQLEWYATQWQIQDDPSPYDHVLKAGAVSLLAERRNLSAIPFE